jgi:hypothetical protein
MFARYSYGIASCAPGGKRRWMDSFARVGRRVTNPPQVANLPHKAAQPQPKRRLEPAATGETACPTKIVAVCKGIRM